MEVFKGKEFRSRSREQIVQNISDQFRHLGGASEHSVLSGNLKEPIFKSSNARECCPGLGADGRV